MEHLKRTPIIILLCLLSFFSCKPTDVISPKALNAQELEAAVQSIPEFQLYQQARLEANETLLGNLKNLNKKSAKWVANMHNKYPTLETFIEKAETLELDTYKELTGLDLVEGDDKSNSLFRRFIAKLQFLGTYDAEDLARIVYPDNQQASIEKFFPSCSNYCTFEAGRQQRIAYSQCTQNFPTTSASCSYKAEMTFRYYLAKCMKSCSGF